MDVRTTALPDRAEYFIDNAGECGEITDMASVVCRLYADPDRLMEIIGGLEWRGLNSRREICLEIERYAHTLLSQVPEPRRSTLTLYGMNGILRTINEIAVLLADWNYEDETKGGCAKDFRDHWRLRRNMTPTPRAMRHLTSPRAIRRYAKRSDEVLHLRKLVRMLAANRVEGPENVEEVQEDIFRDLQLQHAIARLDRVKLFDRKPRERRTRRVLKRAAVIAAAVVGAANVSALARGEPVCITGDSLVIEASLAHDIAAEGHGALRLTLRGLDGSRLAGLCMYQEAPALDQLTSIALHLSAGEERAVLSAGNLYAIDPAAISHPALQDRVKPPPISADDGRGFLAMFGRRAEERYRAGMVAYKAKYLPVYREAVATAVLGVVSRGRLEVIGAAGRRQYEA
ncbi:hypothetical protein [Chelatococcus asaccharovorans]|uniref:Uncharacterized protein n=1 Tax=Chelatococcus asaccharovorans TaxID=28210 RepID=A0A2V3UAY6_9HYPH|nr:hypothetical protein [Chelatococcus asaccharovorans]MBS7703258.1 hypothetical protein [Chelatococcus asaccharovorans]PXW61589.1 hypothetical protein C7450_103106 [Chelatococcus asaccharovorans]